MNANELRRSRIQLRLSQARLARLAGVPRFKIVFFELGDRPLAERDQQRILTAIRQEAQRIYELSAAVAVGSNPTEAAMS